MKHGKIGNMATKNPAAVELGLLGGRKGGLARAKGMTAKERSESARNAAAGRMKKLTPKERSDIARKAAHVRWDKSAKISTQSSKPTDSTQVPTPPNTQTK